MNTVARLEFLDQHAFTHVELDRLKLTNSHIIFFPPRFNVGDADFLG